MAEKLKRICVYCGSNVGNNPIYKETAVLLGQALAEHQIGLVFGGSHVGLMGAVADGVLQHGGEVIGVIPQALADKDLAHKNLTEIHVVNSMHERKALMAELSDGYIVLPGGIGSLDEFFEIWTWAQLGIHEKPCGILNVNTYYDRLLSFIDHVASQQFLHHDHRHMIIVEQNPHDLLQRFKAYEPPNIEKWF